MSDLTDRLRRYSATNTDRGLTGEAADEIDRLRTYLDSAQRIAIERGNEVIGLRSELASTNERWEKSHQIALAIQDERDALRERVAVLEAALHNMLEDGDKTDRAQALAALQGAKP